MRLLHTSDWHLGRTLHGTVLHEAQTAALAHIVDVARREDVDAVLISGDIYDRAVPPIESVRLLGEVLRELASFTQVIVSSGNHDSAVRLGFGAEMFAGSLHVRTRVDRIADPIVLYDDHGPLHVYALPYLDPDTTRHALARAVTGDPAAEPLARSHEAVVGGAMALVRADLAERSRQAGVGPAGSPGGLRSVVLAHAFVAGVAPEQRSESERDISVGGVEVVPSSVFDGVTYVALGHLHGPQEPKRNAPGTILRYSGSPLRYSFSEAGQDKSVTLVDLDADGVKSISTVAVPQPRPMAEVRGRLADLISAPEHVSHVGSWVKAHVTDPVRPQKLNDSLRAVFPHLLSVLHEPEGVTAPTGAVTRPGMRPFDVVVDFLRELAGPEGVDDTETQIVRQAFEAVTRSESA